MAERKKRLSRLLHKMSALYSAVILCGTIGTLSVATLLYGRGDHDGIAIWQPLLRAHDAFMLALGQDEFGNVYITEERLLRRSPSPDTETAEAAANALKDFAESSSAPVYLLAVPTSAGIYGNTLPEHAPLAGEHTLLRTVSGQLDDRLTWIEAESWLEAEKEQYIYYRTDPCWTSYGAFCVYRTAIRKLGFTAVGYDRYMITHFTDNYYGPLAQDSYYDRIKPDLIDLYRNEEGQPLQSISAVQPDGSEIQLSGYEQPELAKQTDDPAAVFGLNAYPAIQAETANENNKELLLLTDDFGSVMMPFLLQHYHRITAVNLSRAEGAQRDLMQTKDVSQVLILVSAETLAKPLNLLPEAEEKG